MSKTPVEPTPWSKDRQPRLVALGMAVLALLVRIPHLGWGLPDIEEEAFPMKKAFEMWGWDQGGALRLDPQTAGWPSLTFYLHLLVQHIHYGLGRLTGKFEDKFDYYVAYQVDPTQLALISRGLSIVVAAVAVYATVRVAVRLGGTLAGVWAGLLLAVSPLFLTESQLIAPDIYIAMFTALAVWQIVRAYDTGETRSFVWAGIWAGLGAAAKYTPALFCVSLFAALLLRRRREGKSLSMLGLDDRRLGMAALASVLAFCLTSPYTLADLETFKRDVAYQSTHLSQGHFGTSEQSGWIYYIGTVLWSALGPVGLLACGLGLAWAAWKRRGVWLVVALCVLPFYATVASLETKFSRYMLPILFPLVLGLAGFVVMVQRLWPAHTTRQRVVIAVVALASLVAPVARSLEYHTLQGRASTQELAKRYIMREIGPEPFFAMERYTPFLPYDDRAEVQAGPVYPFLRPAQRERLFDRQFYRYQNLPLYSTHVQLSEVYYDLRLLTVYDYVVTSGSVQNRYEKNPSRFATQVRFYRDLDNYCTLVKEFLPEELNTRGPAIRVYQFDAAAKQRIIAERGDIDVAWFTPHLANVHAPHFYAFMEAIGEFALERQDYAHAELYYRVLEQTAPQADKVYFAQEMARAILHQNRFEEAVALYQTVLAHESNNAVAAGNLALALEELGRINEARNWYQRCLELAGAGSQEGQWAQRRLSQLPDGSDG